MQIQINDSIAAAITLSPDKVAGNMPIFVAKDEEDQNRMATLLSNILKGTAHDLGDGTLIIVKH